MNMGPTKDQESSEGDTWNDFREFNQAKYSESEFKYNPDPPMKDGNDFKEVTDQELPEKM